MPLSTAIPILQSLEPVFYRRGTAADADETVHMQAAVADLERRGAQQLVLDLSDNRGGLVSEAIEIARLFLPGGSTVVSTRSVSTTKVTRVDKSSPVTVCPSRLDYILLL